MRRTSLAVFSCVLFVSTHAASAAILTVDGSLSDWGFTVADSNLSTFVPAGGLTILGSFVEDQSDTAGDGGFVGPNSGGQNYDAEALFAAAQSGSLFLSIVSGQRPDNGLSKYGPGDLRITTNLNVYGVEFGGGAGGGAGTLITEGASGSTYTLNSGGFTTAHTVANVVQTAGSVWRNPSWILDPLAPPEQTQLQFTGGTLMGSADYTFTRDTVTTQHSIIELSIPYSFFNGETITNIVWRPACGNDELPISNATIITPEPSSLALLGLGMMGLVGIQRRRRK